MKTARAGASQGFSPIAAALISLLPHSICCGVPLLLIALGLGGLSTASYLAHYHVPLTIVGIAALVYGGYVYWRNYHRQTCSCHSCSRMSQRCALCLLCMAAFIQVGMLALIVSSADAAPTEADLAAATLENKLAFQLTGLHCPGCAVEMEFKVEEMEGVESASIQFSKKLLTLLTTSPGVNPESLANDLEELGYCEVRPVIPSVQE